MVLGHVLALVRVLGLRLSRGRSLSERPRPLAGAGVPKARRGKNRGLGSKATSVLLCL